MSYGIRNPFLAGTCRGLLLSLGVSAAAVGVVSTAAECGAQTVKVSVDASKRVNILTSTSLGVPAMMSSGETFSPATAQYLKVIGATTLRYPGNHGSADLYHWETQSFTPYKGMDKPYAVPESNFGNFATLLDKVGGTAVVVVNYGSNAKGDGGGDPGEAAAWVAYANGDAANTSAIAAGAAGSDWKTVGYWAGLRSADKLATDDGFNFLRISHPKPLGIRLWEIGDQVFNNGFYGSDHAGDADLHGVIPGSPKELGKLRKDAKISPTAFATNLLDFSKAMKAVDPTIQIGVGLATPPDGDKAAPDFNSTVIKKSCAALDFVTLDWTPAITQGPDYKTLDDDQTFTSSRGNLNDIFGRMLSDDKTFCPNGHIPRVQFATAGVPSWPKFSHPVYPALWIADMYSLLIESGTQNINWLELYGDNTLSNDRKKLGPAFYGLQMIHIVAHVPGDELVTTKSSSDKLAIHATKRRDGIVGLLLVNEDQSLPATVQVSLTGVKVGAKGKRFDYGTAQMTAGTGLAGSDMAGLGETFSITIPADTVTAVLVPITP